MRFPVITLDFQVIAGHRLRASSGPCKFIHGHNYLFQLTLERNHPRARQNSSSVEPVSYVGLNEGGMVADFDEVRAALAPVLESFDHCFFVQEDDPLLKAEIGSMIKPYLLPCAPTAENLAKEFFDEAGYRLTGGGVLVKKVVCVEAPGCAATYEGV